MARVSFDPIDEEIECLPGETILDAAFRSGYSLVYGCREGQCSACKCYLLEGDVELKPYSSFALSDSEEEQGYTLLCRAIPEDDVVVELLHYDPDNYRLDVPIRDGWGVVESLEDVTHDITRLVVGIDEPDDFDYKPGQYVDVHAPGTEERRSFSIASLPGEGRIELLVKRYPGGLIAGQLEHGEIAVGSTLRFTGPYGSFYLRDGDGLVLMIAGGSGMAPELALLRELVASRATRPVRFFYGARTRSDLFDLDVIAELGEQLPDFAFVPVLSEEDWDGESGLVHDVAGRYLAAHPEMTADIGVYVCGPPPMVDAAIETVSDTCGVPDTQVFFDKFTSTAAVVASDA